MVMLQSIQTGGYGQICTVEQIRRAFSDNLGILFCDSNEYPQHMFLWRTDENYASIEPRQVNLLLIAYASSKGSGEPAHLHRKPDPWPL